MKPLIRTTCIILAALHLLAAIAAGWIIAVTGDLWFIENKAMFGLVVFQSAIAFGAVAAFLTILDS